MVCPICITSFIAANAPVIISTSAAISGLAAVKLNQVPKKKTPPPPPLSTQDAVVNEPTRANYHKK
jgi:hypothetical protein